MKNWAKHGTMPAVLLLLTACSVIHSNTSYPSRDSIAPGQTVIIKGNQNVYAVARENNVSMRDLIVLNNLQPPFALHSGQSLVLPAGASGGGSSYGVSSYGGAPTPAAAPSGAIEQVPLAPIEVAPLPPPKMRPTAIDSLNKPTPAAAPVPTTMNNAKIEPQAVTAAPPAPPHPPSMASAAPSSAPAAIPATRPDMVWPVQGPVVSSFGPKGQGLNNDGINIGAPKGAPVVAAANGIVVYAGNEMKGFGNLVLLRHPDGWVTAYAHLDRMLVAKDAVVARGDMIGTVGKTGSAPSPQLHFETRYQGKPVDPATLMKTQ